MRKAASSKSPRPVTPQQQLGGAETSELEQLQREQREAQVREYVVGGVSVFVGAEANDAQQTARLGERALNPYSVCAGIR